MTKKKKKKYPNFSNLPLEDRYGPGVLNFKVGVPDAVAEPDGYGWVAGRGEGGSFLYRLQRERALPKP